MKPIFSSSSSGSPEDTSNMLREYSSSPFFKESASVTVSLEATTILCSSGQKKVYDPLLDFVPYASEGFQFFLFTSLDFGGVAEAMLEVTLGSG